MIELLKQRRIWAGFCAAVALLLSMSGVQFDADEATNSIMGLIEAISGVMAVILPLVSYFKPKV